MNLQEAMAHATHAAEVDACGKSGKALKALRAHILASPQAVTDEQIDQHLDAVLRASGSGLKNYSMQKSKDDMRAAMRNAVLALSAPPAAETINANPALEKVAKLYANPVATGALNASEPAASQEAKPKSFLSQWTEVIMDGAQEAKPVAARMSAVTEDTESIARATRAIIDSPAATLQIIRNMQMELVVLRTIAAIYGPKASSQEAKPVAVIRFERGTSGLENEMPLVISCNWLPDGDYSVYAAAPQEQAPGNTVVAMKIACWIDSCIKNGETDVDFLRAENAKIIDALNTQEPAPLKRCKDGVLGCKCEDAKDAVIAAANGSDEIFLTAALDAIDSVSSQEQAPASRRDIFGICDAYESGIGHGLQQDGLDLSRTPHGNPEHGQAYQIGYEAGVERAQGRKKEPAPADKDAIRNAALEEAALICDRSSLQPAIARAIRRLQSQPQQVAEKGGE